jgi:hypothetical protein
MPERSLTSLGISPAGSTPAKRLNLGSWRSTAELLQLVQAVNRILSQQFLSHPALESLGLLLKCAL